MKSSSSPTISPDFSIPRTAVVFCGVGTAVPDFFATQSQSLEFILKRFPIAERTRQLYKKTLGNLSIEKRHFALASLENVLEKDLDKKNARFEKESVALSTRALRLAISNAGLVPADIDFLAVTTCTGYICPGLSSHVMASVGLRPDVRVADLVGMGCGAAIPAIEQAHNFLTANPGKIAAVISTEICSAAMVSNDDIDIVISNTIFADGSAAVILSSPWNVSIQGPRFPLRENGSRLKDCRDDGFATAVIRGFQSLTIPEWRDTLRFKSENGHLRNVLGKNVPRQSAQAMKKISEQLLSDAGLEQGDISHWVLHAGGEKVLDAMESGLCIAPEFLSSSRSVLKRFGNMSSPTVLFVLAEEIRSKRPAAGEWGIIGSFGAGFSAHGALLQWI